MKEREICYWTEICDLGCALRPTDIGLGDVDLTGNESGYIKESMKHEAMDLVHKYVHTSTVMHY